MKQFFTTNASIDLTVRRGKEFLSIILETEHEVIYYARKYIKQGWEVYSIDKGAKIKITYEYY
jgi:hypothetical protein